MRFCPTRIAGVVVVEREALGDDRGFFARLHCPDAFARAGHPFTPAQTSLSHNRRAGTLRGLHWQAPPHAETKLVRVVRGHILDVCVDVRPGSPTFRQWVAVDLNAENGRALLIGEGIAHGFLTRRPDTDVLYQIAPGHDPASARNARWNDPAFAIAWPEPPTCLSDRDRDAPDFRPESPEPSETL